LLREDPNIDTINARESFFSVWTWYPDLVSRRDASTNLLRPTFDRLRISQYKYQAHVYLSPSELEWGRKQVESLSHPIATFHTRSKEDTKNWPLEAWTTLLPRLADDVNWIHLGDDAEPVFPGVTRFAGGLSMRESLAILAHADLHVGPVSFLMHGANGLNVRSIIVYGGRETPKNSGYENNVNLYTPMECSPCWIHSTKGECCPNALECMRKITFTDVENAIRCVLKRPRIPSSISTNTASDH
jgi:ADP-heptose:LPS heptosyltransferase